MRNVFKRPVASIAQVDVFSEVVGDVEIGKGIVIKQMPNSGEGVPHAAAVLLVPTTEEAREPVEKIEPVR